MGNKPSSRRKGNLPINLTSPQIKDNDTKQIARIFAGQMSSYYPLQPGREYTFAYGSSKYSVSFSENKFIVNKYVLNEYGRPKSFVELVFNQKDGEYISLPLLIRKRGRSWEICVFTIYIVI